MKNEEKAAAIGVFVKDTCVTYGVSQDNAEIASTLCQQSAMQMAEWKDEQFRQLIKDYIELAYNEGSHAHILEDLLKEF